MKNEIRRKIENTNYKMISNESEGSWNGRKDLMCPYCECDDGLHIIRVDVQTGNNVTSTTSAGTFVKNGCGPNVSRGSVTVLQFDCESCGHITEIMFKFYKGSIVVDIFDLGNRVSGKRRDIWRD